ncbi:YdhK family protein [Aneurinibacillus sp. Ricciae_BoGa-3]|uniref:YdhK family protein n=1 Tax=Aneurinibacillus sp. Ricciae_BoGa-3 TaxID=3022697 RepID=UPI0023410ACC|nr:YdhK family protein [Aneurinibacillus sp. Ricciae_BoGa-3]WCK52923.1 YdhK family protein [Aneurinibacillus sp. Ricciae_BoGa-3]
MSKIKPILISSALLFLLAGCSSNNNQNANPNTNQGNKSQGNMNQGNMNHNSMNHGNMDMSHSSSGAVAKGLKEAKNPAFKIGSQAIIQADHMPGMKGAKATIVGAYDTTVYSVTYTPTTGGPKVTNHKWVIHEEIKDAGSQPFKPGEKVTLEADHMPGMKGAPATVDTAQHTTVYMVDYTPTTGRQPVKNHQWLIGSELSAE